MVPLAHVGGGVLEPLQLLPPFAALALVALVSPLAHLGEELILAHMAQHVVMADLAALLMVLGLTGPLLQPVLATRVVRRLRVLAHPVVAFGLWAIDLYVWHIPALYEASLSSELVHALQHGTFVLFGFNMWLALLGPMPQPEWFGNGARLLYIVGVRFTGALLGNVFLWSESVFYPDYRPGQAEWDLSPLQDQGVAGWRTIGGGGIVIASLVGWV